MPQTQELEAFDVRIYQTHSECWTKWGVLACYTNSGCRTSTDSGAGEGAGQKIGEPRRWVSMNLGYGAHRVTGVVPTIHLKRQDKGQTMAQHRGLTHLGSIWDLPPIIRILNNSIHFLVKDPHHPENPHYHWDLSMDITRSKWHFGFSVIEVWPDSTGTLWILQRVTLTYLLSSFPFRFNPFYHTKVPINIAR